MAASTQLVKSTVLNDTSSDQKLRLPPLTMMNTGFEEIEENGADMSRANAVETEEAAHLADGSVKEQNTFHNYETAKSTRKARKPVIIAGGTTEQHVAVFLPRHWLYK